MTKCVCNGTKEIDLSTLVVWYCEEGYVYRGNMGGKVRNNDILDLLSTRLWVKLRKLMKDYWLKK